jgi:hypothetical protein
MKLSGMALYNVQRFVISPIESLLNRLRAVYHHQLSRRRKQIDEGEYQPILTAQGLEGVRQTFYGGVGVGVFQGEAVTIQKWVFLQSHQWVIGKLQPQDSHLYQEDTVCKLLQTALILAHYLQCEPEKNRSQSPDEIQLLTKCPHAKQQKSGEGSFSMGCESVECPLQKLLAKELMQLLYQHSPEYLQCPFERIIDLLNQGVNESGKEPASLLHS